MQNNFSKFTLFILLLVGFFCPFAAARAQGQDKIVYINDNGFIFKTNTQKNKVKDLLLELEIRLNPKDVIFPDIDSNFGDRIIIQRSIPALVAVDGKKETYFTNKNKVSDLLEENKISLGAEDKINFSLKTALFSNIEIIITRVDKETIKTEKEIDFPIEKKEDPDLELGKEKIIQTGVKGLKEEEYLVIYENKKEVKRTLQQTKILKEPEPQVMVLGTKIIKGRTEEGLASFLKKGIYQGMAAAHKTWPFGRKVKVTNLENGKSIVVKIIDRGPYVDGRVIDLSYEAFDAIANLGAGVVKVRIEEILN